MPNFISCLTCTSYDGRLKIIKHLPDPSSGLQWIPLCFLQICIFLNSYWKPDNSLLFFTCSHQCQHHLLSTGSAQCALTRSCSSCVFFGACMFWASFSRQAPHLELVSANWKVRVNIFPSGLFIAAHPALSWCLILSGSRRRLPIVRSHDHPPAIVRRWMGFKGLQETWVRPPCLLVSPAAPSEKTPSVSPCQSSAGCRSHTFQPDLFTSKAKPLGLGWDIPTFGPVLLLQSVIQNWGVKDHV